MAAQSIPCLRACLHPECSQARRAAIAVAEAQAAAPAPEVEREAGKAKTFQQASSVQQAPRGRFVPGEQQRQARGGTARSQRLAPERRQDIARRAAASRWGGKGAR